MYKIKKNPTQQQQTYKRTKKQHRNQTLFELAVALIVKHYYNLLRKCRDFESTDRIACLAFVSSSVI